MTKFSFFVLPIPDQQYIELKLVVVDGAAAAYSGHLTLTIDEAAEFEYALGPSRQQTNGTIFEFVRNN